jgi:Zn-dependent peptidase ImmA (M78 family)
MDPQIEQRAYDILAKHNMLMVPVPIETVAAAQGAVIARNHFNGKESGFALRQGRRRIIGVNTSTSPRRQRFTVGHELGHLELHDSKDLIVDHSFYVYKRDELSSLGSDQQEIEANGFAAAVLMPRRLILERLNVELEKDDFQSRDEIIARMARTFDVSNEAMGFRLINLNIITA